MTFQDYVTSKRSTKKIPTDILARWQERIVATGLDKQGVAGARSYLALYGKNSIAAPKCISLARCAESEDRPEMAVGFWAKAYELETGLVADGNLDGYVVVVGKTVKPAAIKIPNFPSHLQPGKIVTMQPVDAPQAEQTPEWFVNNPEFWGQPKRDGQRLVIIGHPSGNYYQRRSGAVVEAPSLEVDQYISQAVAMYGPFVIDTECWYSDANGGEHRTGAQAAFVNTEIGQPECPVRPCISIFDGLMFDGEDITSIPKRARLSIIRVMSYWLASRDEVCFEYLAPAQTMDDKKTLVAYQKMFNREGEVWFHPNDSYHGDKDKKHFSTGVRTKHLTEREVVVTGFTPTTAAGRPFGAIGVSELVNGELVPRGNVGTGYTVEEMVEIYTRFHAEHGLAIVVRSQGLTENGILWLGRFDSIVK